MPRGILIFCSALLFGCAGAPRHNAILFEDPEFDYREEGSYGQHFLHYQATSSVGSVVLRAYIERRAERLCGGSYRFTSYEESSAVSLCEKSVELLIVDAEVRCGE
jgi:hypothetical protein